jgi:two-component system cell cycle sensor histidine kinase PleC
MMQAESLKPAPAAPRAPRDIPHASAVNELRARMSHGSTMRPELEYELLKLVARHEKSAQVMVPLLAVILGGTCLFWASPYAVAGWLAAVFATQAGMIYICRRLQAMERSAVKVGTWRDALVSVEAACGLGWAGLAVLTLGVSDTAASVFLLVALVAVLAIRMTYTSSVLAIFYAGTLPITVTVVGRFLMEGDHLHLALAAIAACMQVYFMMLARGLNRAALAMIQFKAEKDALIAEIEEEKWISDEARRNAESANIAKSRFLATMSHELRTPLNAILGFSEVMICEVLGPMQNKSYKEYAGNIHDSGKHLLQLINEILDLSRIEAGRYELHEEAVRLNAIAEDCLRLLHLRAESKGLQVLLEFPRNLELIWADERALRQVCLNLLSKALKITPSGGEITITVAAEADGGQRLVVTDNGPGIPADEIPRVMQAFGQGSLAHQTAEGGTGLGLPIVKNLVQLHGGIFELNSQVGKGTECVVRLPKSRVLATVPPLQPLGQERHRRQAQNAPRRRASDAMVARA